MKIGNRYISDRLLLFTIILSGVLFYLPSIQYGFAQDDFIHLAASQATTFGQFLTFFNPFAEFEAMFFIGP